MNGLGYNDGACNFISEKWYFLVFMQSSQLGFFGHLLTKSSVSGSLSQALLFREPTLRCPPTKAVLKTAF